MYCELMWPEPAGWKTAPERSRRRTRNCRAPRFGGARQSLGVAQICQKGAVDNVNRFDLGSGCTSAGLARIRYVFWTFQCLQGLECGSSPTSSTYFPCSGACGPLSVHKLFTDGPLRGPFFVGGRCCGRLPPCPAWSIFWWRATSSLLFTEWAT